MTLSGKESCLSLISNDPNFADHVQSAHVTGLLTDSQSITMLNCVPVLITKTGKADQAFTEVRIFPNLVLVGESTVSENERFISSISFDFDDLSTLFYDFDAFGIAFKPKDLMKEVARSFNEHANRELTIGDEPIVAYFSGNREIARFVTSLGTIIASHNPSYSSSFSKGITIQNQIKISLEVRDPIDVHSAIEYIAFILRFFEIVLGRPQNIGQVMLVDGGNGGSFELHWNHKPMRRLESNVYDDKPPAPGDVLMSPLGNPEEFEYVLSKWLETNREHLDARTMFFDSVSDLNRYTSKRMVTACNMFDRLPAKLYTKVKLPTLIKDLLENSKSQWEKLENSPERNSVLGALGRLGMPSLFNKMVERASLLPKCDEYFPELSLVIRQAVYCRNYYVHGSNDSKIDFDSNFQVVVFLTNTAEFIFGTAELVTCGWDFERFVNQPSSLTNPFGAFVQNYNNNLNFLRSFLPEQVPVA